MKLIKRILQIILGIICITPFVLGVGAGIYFMLGVIIHEIPKIPFMEWLIGVGILLGVILVFFLVSMLTGYGWILITGKKK